jgi:hypothetical protein
MIRLSEPSNVSANGTKARGRSMRQPNGLIPGLRRGLEGLLVLRLHMSRLPRATRRKTILVPLTSTRRRTCSTPSLPTAWPFTCRRR